MIRRPPRSTLSSSSAASDVYKRQILMTSFAFIAGLIPLVNATGASALGNRSIGTGAVGGMLTGVLLGIFIIPVLFVVFQNIQEKVTSKTKVSSKEILTPAIG